MVWLTLIWFWLLQGGKAAAQSQGAGSAAIDGDGTMTWLQILDVAYKLVTGFGVLSLVGLTVRALIQLGAWEQWVKTIDKEVTSHGGMLQQLTGSVNRMLGRMESGGDGGRGDGQKKDG